MLVLVPVLSRLRSIVKYLNAVLDIRSNKFISGNKTITTSKAKQLPVKVGKRESGSGEGGKTTVHLLGARTVNDPPGHAHLFRPRCGLFPCFPLPPRVYNFGEEICRKISFLLLIGK